MARLRTKDPNISPEKVADKDNPCAAAHEWKTRLDQLDAAKKRLERMMWQRFESYFKGPRVARLARDWPIVHACSMRRVVVVSGSIGVGKSAALKVMREAIAERVGEVAVLESDDFYMMIDPDWTLPPSRVDWYFEISGWLLRETALGFLQAGFDWVAIASNGLWRESQAREFTRPFARRGVDSHHITLDPGEEVALARIAVRDHADEAASAMNGDEGLRMLSDVRGCYGPWTHVIDNRAMTPRETAVAIYDAVAAGYGRL